MKSPKKRTWRQRSVAYLFGWATRILFALLFCTCREQTFGREITERYRREHPGKGLLYATWHRGLMYLIYRYRNRGAVVMASASKDGDLAAAATGRHGWVVVRGSSSYRGSEALREMLPFIEAGHIGGLVVDAPRGPAHVSKMGIIVAARRSGIPVLPVIWAADRCWRIGSWDRTIIPKPFAHIVFLYGNEFIRVPGDAGREDCEAYRRRLDEILNTMMYRVDRFFTAGVDDPRRIDVPADFLKNPG